VLGFDLPLQELARAASSEVGSLKFSSSFHVRYCLHLASRRPSVARRRIPGLCPLIFSAGAEHGSQFLGTKRKRLALIAFEILEPRIARASTWSGRCVARVRSIFSFVRVFFSLLLPALHADETFAFLMITPNGSATFLHLPSRCSGLWRATRPKMRQTLCSGFPSSLPRGFRRICSTRPSRTFCSPLT